LTRNYSEIYKVLFIRKWLSSFTVVTWK